MSRANKPNKVPQVVSGHVRLMDPNFEDDNPEGQINFWKKNLIYFNPEPGVGPAFSEVARINTVDLTEEELVKQAEEERRVVEARRLEVEERQRLIQSEFPRKAKTRSKPSEVLKRREDAIYEARRQKVQNLLEAEKESSARQQKRLIDAKTKRDYISRLAAQNEALLKKRKAKNESVLSNESVFLLTQTNIWGKANKQVIKQLLPKGQIWKQDLNYRAEAPHSPTLTDHMAQVNPAMGLPYKRGVVIDDLDMIRLCAGIRDPRTHSKLWSLFRAWKQAVFKEDSNAVMQITNDFWRLSQSYKGNKTRQGLGYQGQVGSQPVALDLEEEEEKTPDVSIPIRTKLMGSDVSSTVKVSKEDLRNTMDSLMPTHEDIISWFGGESRLNRTLINLVCMIVSLVECRSVPNILAQITLFINNEMRWLGASLIGYLTDQFRFDSKGGYQNEKVMGHILNGMSFSEQVMKSHLGRALWQILSLLSLSSIFLAIGFRGDMSSVLMWKHHIEAFVDKKSGSIDTLLQRVMRFIKVSIDRFKLAVSKNDWTVLLECLPDPTEWTDQCQFLLEDECIRLDSARLGGADQFQRKQREGIVPARYHSQLTKKQRELELRSLAGEGDRLVKLYGEHMDMQMKYMIRNMQTRLNAAVYSLSNQELNGQFRVQPFGTFIVGPPGVGKSFLIPLIHRSYAKVCGLPLGSETMYEIPANANFYDGFTGAQWHAVFDDIDQIVGSAQPDTETHVTKVINLINTKPYMMEQAAVEAKGRYYANFLSATYCSNFADGNLQGYSRDPAAFWRRFRVRIAMSVKKRFSGANGGLDASKLDGSNDYWVFKVSPYDERYYQPNNPFGSFPYGDPVEMSLYDMVAYLTKAFIAWKTAQSALLLKNMTMDREEICPTCGQIIDCHPFKTICSEVILPFEGVALGPEEEDGDKANLTEPRNARDTALMVEIEKEQRNAKIRVEARMDAEKVVKAARNKPLTQGGAIYWNMLRLASMDKHLVLTIAWFLLFFWWWYGLALFCLGFYGAGVMLYRSMSEEFRLAASREVVVSYAVWKARNTSFVDGLTLMRLRDFIPEEEMKLRLALIGKTYLERIGLTILGLGTFYVGIKMVNRWIKQSRYQGFDLKADRMTIDQLGQERAKWIRVPTVRTSVDTIIQSNTVNKDDLLRVVANRMFYVTTVRNGSRTLGFLIEGNKMLMNKHIFIDNPDTVDVPMTAPLNDKLLVEFGPEKYLMDVLFGTNAVVVGKADLVVVAVTGVFPVTTSAADPMKHLPMTTQRDVRGLLDECWLVQPTVLDGIKSAGVRELRGSYDKIPRTISRADVNCIKYDNPRTVGGDCGSMVVCRLGSNIFIGGMHSHFDPAANIGLAAELVGEDILAACHTLDKIFGFKIPDAYIDSFNVTGGYQSVKTIALPNKSSLAAALPHMICGLRLLGTIDPPVINSNPRSKCSKTLFAEDFRDFELEECGKSPYFESPDFKGRMEGERWMDPYVFQLCRMRNTHINEDVVRLAVRDYLTGLNTLSGREAVGPLSNYDTWMGIDGTTLNAVNIKTSAGAPFFTRKDKFVSLNHKEKVVEVAPIIEEHINRILGVVDSGLIYVPLCVHTLKDEPVSVDKNAKHGVRVFNTLPLAYNFLIKKFIGPICMFMRSHPSFFECAVGMNINHPVQLSNLLEGLLKRGSRFGDGDFEGLDVNLGISIRLGDVLVFKLMAMYFGYSEIDVQRVVLLMLGTAYSLRCIKNDLFLVAGFNPSGGQVTLEINSIDVCLYFRGCFRNLALKQARSVELFRLVVGLVVLGDDNLSSRAEEYSWFNGETLKDELAKMGQTYTSADKHSAIVALKDLEGCSFLKRRFRKEAVGWFAALEKKSLAKMLVYRKGSELGDRDHCAVILSNVMRESFMHGADFFNTMRRRCVDVANRYGLDKSALFVDRDFDKSMDIWRTGQYEPWVLT